MAIYQVTILDREPVIAFPFEAATPELAARDVAADGDFEPWEHIEIAVRDGSVVYVFEIYTHPPYAPVLLEERRA